MKQNEYGRSMIEMLGVLAVIGLLSVGGFDLITKANNSRKAAAVIDEIGSLAGKARVVMRDYQASAATPAQEEEEDADAEDVTAYIYHGRAYPDTLEYSDDKFVGTDDVEYQIYYPDNEAVLFIIRVSELPSDICTQIATIDWGSRSSNGFLGMDIDADSVANLSTVLSTNGSPDDSMGIAENSTHPVPMSIGKATTLCDEDKDGELSINFAFR